MSTPIQQTAPARPRGRALLWVGGVLGALAIAQIAYQGLDWMSSTTTASTEVYAVAPVVELRTDGDVTVTVGGAGGVTVEERTRTGFQRVTYEVTQAADRLTVDHSCPRWWSNGVCQIDLTVQVPADTDVVVRSSSGAVRAEGVAGHLDLRTSDGDVTVLRADGRVDAHTDAGRVLVDGAGGDVTATSGDGDVETRAVDGSAVATTGAGRVEVGGVTGDVEARTADGHVVVRSTGTPVALEISTGDGRSTVEAPTDPSASRTVLIRSGAGDVSYLDAE